MKITFDPKYEKLANAVVSDFRSRGLRLSKNAEVLLRVCVESWFEDTPMGLKSTIPSDQSPMLYELAHRIVIEALSDEHVVGHIKALDPEHRTIQFHEILYALGVSGRKVLGNILQKGF